MLLIFCEFILRLCCFANLTCSDESTALMRRLRSRKVLICVEVSFIFSKEQSFGRSWWFSAVVSLIQQQLCQQSKVVQQTNTLISVHVHVLC